jgi:acetylglutamate kinase
VDALIQKADILLEALPYIQRFSGKTLVVKYGGHAMQDEDLKQQFAQDIVLLKYVGMNPVVVHGGGPQIGHLLKTLGITSEFVRGMRVTDAATMDVGEMVLGKLNQEIATLINRQGGKAVGLSGKDGEMIIAQKMLLTVSEDGQPPKTYDIGQVGEVVGVNPDIVHALTKANFIPVIAPIGIGEDGTTYNINADLVAGKVAEALEAEKLILLTDVEGIKDHTGSLISTLASDQAATLIEENTINAGMIPKVECCIDALHGGVKKTHIIDGRVRHAILLEIFTKEGIGTEVIRRSGGQT